MSPCPWVAIQRGGVESSLFGRRGFILLNWSFRHSSHGFTLFMVQQERYCNVYCPL